MRTLRWLPTFRAAAVSAAALVLLGLASNVVSSGYCEADTRASVTAQFRRGGPPPQLVWLRSASLRNVAHDRRGETTLAFFSGHRGQRYFRERIYLPASPFDGPWAFTRPHLFDCPFVVRVYYGHGGHDGPGCSALREYVTFFGLRFLLSHDSFFLT